MVLCKVLIVKSIMCCCFVSSQGVLPFHQTTATKKIYFHPNMPWCCQYINFKKKKKNGIWNVPCTTIMQPSCNGTHLIIPRCFSILDHCSIPISIFLFLFHAARKCIFFSFQYTAATRNYMLPKHFLVDKPPETQLTTWGEKLCSRDKFCANSLELLTFFRFLICMNEQMPC